ncbi:hypothetical protein XELAEV_18045747mg, partial [Xenopus laevis]
TLTGNLLIILLNFTDSHLHTSMYFFLGTLACLDMSYSSATVPKMLFVLLADRKTISVQMSVLAVMSYDRYIAICHPLHYMQIMNWNVCVQLVSGILVFCVVHSLVHMLFLTKLTFCSSHNLQSFFCDLPQLLQISCSDTFINVLLIFLSGILFGVVILGATFYPYITIIRTVLNIPSKNMRYKAFSTCSSHLTVIFILYSTSFCNYFRTNANDQHTEDKTTSVFYAVLSPCLNPMIYSLRNQDIKTSLRKNLQRIKILG